MAGGVRLGEEFAGYRIEAILGRGGMSVVYLAEDPRLGRKVTLKVLAPELMADPAFRKRFENESRIAAALDHPNVVPIYEAGEAEGRLFIAMRYVRGTDLDALIRDEGPLSPGRCGAIVHQVAAALDAAHREGLVHRDVKPANVLIAPGTGREVDHAYLTDFGITKRPAQGPITTRTGEIMGTVDYVAPEQVEGKPVDFRADVYSLGCVAYQILTGDVPFQRESDLAVLWAHVHEKPPRATVKRPELAAGVDAVLSRAMAKEPRDRFESCGALSSALQDRLDASPSLAPERIRPPRTPTRRALPTGRLRIMVVVAAALVVAAVTGAVLLSGGSSAPACPRFARSRKTLEQIVPKFVAPGTFRTAPPRADDLAVDQHGIWVVTPSGADLMCARPGQVGGSLALPFRPTALAMGDNGVWVAGTARGSRASGSNPGRVTRIVSPAIAPGPSRDLQDPPRAVAVGVGSKAIWILSTRGTLLRLSRPDVGPEGGTPIQVRSVRVGAGASDVVVGDTDVWVSNERSSTLISVDPTTLRRIGRPISLPGGAALAATPGTIWSLDREAQALTPIDTRTRRRGRSIPVGRLPLDVEAANGYVWVANGWSVWRVDPRTHDIRKAPVAGRVIAFTVQPPSLTRGQAIWALVRKPHER